MQVNTYDKYSKVADMFRGAMKQEGFTKQQAIDFIEQLKEAEQDMDYDYIRCVLFPEIYPAARIPSRFSMPSALFTHKFSCYINTNIDGAGFVSFLPQDTAFHCLYKHTAGGSYDGNPSNNLLSTVDYIPESDSRYITSNFSSVRLIAASMRVSYIGQAQQESGFMTGAQVYEAEIGRISEEICDNGYFNVRGRPFEGMRLVYVPKDNSDQEFHDTNMKLQDLNSSANLGLFPVTEVHSYGPNFNVQTNLGGAWLDSVGDKIVLPSQVWGLGAKKLQSNTPTQLICQWRGLPQNQTWIRIDVDRHFEGTPRTAVRDIVSVSKPKSNERTLDAIKKLSDRGELFGQTNLDSKRIFDNIKGNLADFIKAQAGTLVQGIVIGPDANLTGEASWDPNQRQLKILDKLVPGNYTGLAQKPLSDYYGDNTWRQKGMQGIERIVNGIGASSMGLSQVKQGIPYMNIESDF